MPQYQQRSNTGQHGAYQQPEAVFDVKALNLLNYVENAEKVIRKHKEGNAITTTQLRGLFSLMTEVREILRIRQSDRLDESMQSRVQYIKMRFVYAAGRGEKGVADFMKQSALVECIDTIKDSAKQFELVCKYMEALVAYHKFYINK